MMTAHYDGSETGGSGVLDGNLILARRRKELLDVCV
jgi:hypothetical protein